MVKKLSKKEARKLLENGTKVKSEVENLNVTVLGNEIETDFLQRVIEFVDREGSIGCYDNRKFIYQLYEFGLELPISITNLAQSYYDFKDEYEIQEAMFLMQVVVNNTLYVMDCTAIEVGNREEEFMLEFGCCLMHYLNNIEQFRNAVEKYEQMNFCQSILKNLGLEKETFSGNALFL